MSPVLLALAAACALLLAVAAAALLTLRRSAARSQAMERSVEALREQVAELARRDAARETAEVAVRAREADWVITFDEEADPTATVSTQRVVGTAFGEPLIKVAALSHGVRRALREERRAHLAFQVRREYRRRRKQSRARARSGR